MTNTLPVAFSYIRWSSAKQTEGGSLDRQDELAVQYAKDHGLALSPITYLDAGVSAYKGKNAAEGELRAFLEACDAGKIKRGSYLLVENFDRLSRASPRAAMRLFEDIVSRGITVVTLKDRRVYSDASIDDDWTQLLTAMLGMVEAHKSSADKSVRVKDGIARKRAEGAKRERCPGWMSLSADRQSYIVDEDYASLIRRIFDMSANGFGAHTIAKTLNDEGVAVRHAGKEVRHWHGPQLVRILRSATVIGTLTSRKGLPSLDDHYPAVVSKALFYEVQTVINTRRRVGQGLNGENVANLFAGLARCAHCGSTMRFSRRKERSGNFAYVHCLNSLYSGGCVAKGIQYDALEDEVLAWLLFDQNEEVVPLFSEKRVDRGAVIRAEIDQASMSRQRLLSLVMDGGLTNTSDVVVQMNVLAERIQLLEASLITASAPIEDPRESVERAMTLFVAHQDARLGDDPAELVKIRHQLRTALRKIISFMLMYTDEALTDRLLQCRVDVQFVWNDEPIEHFFTRAVRRVLKREKVLSMS